MALFAASKKNCIEPEKWVSWLVGDNSYWLWSDQTRREVCRLLVLQGNALVGKTKEILEEAILCNHDEKAKWLRLVKLKVSGLSLNVKVDNILSTIENKNPTWKVDSYESEEFPHFKRAPQYLDELVEWLNKPKEINNTHFKRDSWRDICRNNFSLSSKALKKLADGKLWPSARWIEALSEWSKTNESVSYFNEILSIILKMPDHILQDETMLHYVTSWMESVSIQEISDVDGILKLSKKILSLTINTGSITDASGQPVDDPVMQAINRSIGHVTQAIINIWFKEKPKENGLISDEIKSLFTVLCDLNRHELRDGRVLLGSRLIPIFRSDPDWARKFLMPIFNWDKVEEAKSVWSGFLWSPVVDFALLNDPAFKAYFFACSSHQESLGKYWNQFVRFFTFLAMDKPDGYTDDEFKKAITQFSKDSLNAVVRSIADSLDSSGDQGENYWTDRVLPFWKNVFPKDKRLISPELSKNLSLLIIRSRGKFPESLDLMKDWLTPISGSWIIKLLYESTLCERFPNESLNFLNNLIAKRILNSKLKKCLDQIEKAKPDLKNNQLYKNLIAFTSR